MELLIRVSTVLFTEFFVARKIDWEMGNYRENLAKIFYISQFFYLGIYFILILKIMKTNPYIKSVPVMRTSVEALLSGRPSYDMQSVQSYDLSKWKSSLSMFVVNFAVCSIMRRQYDIVSLTIVQTILPFFNLLQHYLVKEHIFRRKQQRPTPFGIFERFFLKKLYGESVNTSFVVEQTKTSNATKGKANAEEGLKKKHKKSVGIGKAPS